MPNAKASYSDSIGLFYRLQAHTGQSGKVGSFFETQRASDNDRSVTTHIN